jgi:hypothetical protein
MLRAAVMPPVPYLTPIQPPRMIRCCDEMSSADQVDDRRVPRVGDLDVVDVPDRDGVSSCGVLHASPLAVPTHPPPR